MQLLEPRNLAAVALAGLVLSTSAQEANNGTDNLRLVELKQEFGLKIRANIAPPSRQYIAELIRLEKKFAASGEFESAIEARDERLALEGFLGEALTAEPDLPEPSTVAQNRGGTIDLSDTSADISSGARFTDNGLDLSATGATARWQLANLQPGGFDIELNYTASGGSKIRVGEDFFHISSDLPATGSDGSCMSLGNLKITSDSDSIYLTNLGSGAGEILIQSLTLISAKD